MRTRIGIISLLAGAVLTAAGCAGPAETPAALGDEPARTEAPSSGPAIATEPASPIPTTQMPPGAPSSTSAPPQAYDYSSRDYGFGADTNGSGDATATTEGSVSTADQTSVGATDSALGLILVNGQGRTLYALTMDAPGLSTCQGSCLENWPPVLATGTPVAGDGVQDGLLGSFARSDGGMQVTYAGKPLYTYAQDAAPGDLNGQGKGGVWFAVTAEGDFAR
jgi:predicted lipoprotein with Yx(FWY)xxD motif